MPFSSLKLHPSLLTSIRELGFARPTPVQWDAIPPSMAGRDVLACAQTGSGKTAAFLLPIMHALMDKPRGRTRALVLARLALALQHLVDVAAAALALGRARSDGLELRVARFGGLELLLALLFGRSFERTHEAP